MARSMKAQEESKVGKRANPFSPGGRLQGKGKAPKKYSINLTRVSAGRDRGM